MFRRARPSRSSDTLAQEPSIFPAVTVSEKRHGRARDHEFTRSWRKGTAATSCSRTSTFRTSRTGGRPSLSGGERRRVEITRAPRGALVHAARRGLRGIDPIAVEEIHRLRDRGLGVLITDHNVRVTPTRRTFVHHARRPHPAVGHGRTRWESARAAVLSLRRSFHALGTDRHGNETLAPT